MAHASIQKQRLHDRYDGAADRNSYLLALQFLVEKIDQLGQRNSQILWLTLFSGSGTDGIDNLTLRQRLRASSK